MKKVLLTVLLSFLVFFFSWQMTLEKVCKPETQQEEPPLAPADTEEVQAIDFQPGFGTSLTYAVTYEDGEIRIYQMPEHSLYDSMIPGKIQLSEEELEELVTGKNFQSLEEVYEFLENCMS